MNTIIENKSNVNWRQVGAFLGLTFGLTFVLDAVIAQRGLTSPGVTLLLQLQMLLPAFSAIVLGMFFFKDSPIFYRTDLGRARWFYYFYLAFTLVLLGLAVWVWADPSQLKQASGAVSGLALLSVVALLVIRWMSGREAFARAGLRGGRIWQWLGYGLVFVAFYAIQIALNIVFRLGVPADLTPILQQMGTSALTPQTLALILFPQMVIFGSLVGLVISFGEEYGWRGYLQSALIGLGKKRGVLLLGLIWSAWHYPVILMGYNYPVHPVLGLVMMTVFTTTLAFVLGYVMLKTQSIWLVAFLHALNNQTLAYLVTAINKPVDTTYSFGLGLYAIPFLLLAVWLVLRDPIWQDAPAEQAAPVLASAS